MKLCAVLLLVCICIWVTTQMEPECENCGCCLEKICAPAQTSVGWKEDVCTHGCVPGYGGYKCYGKCAADCLTCEQQSRLLCATCDEGKYLNAEKHCVDCPANCVSCISSTNCIACKDSYYPVATCSQLCSSRCKTCTSWTNCQECHVPYYNVGNITDCSLACPANCACSHNGDCLSCKDGFYDTGAGCMYSCPHSCLTCSSHEICTACKSGYYNEGEVNNCSYRCRSACFSCSSFDTCILCKQGNYGAHCQYKLSAVPMTTVAEQTIHTGTVGIAVGVSSAVTIIVTAVVVIVVVCVFQKIWKRKQKHISQVRYVNTTVRDGGTENPVEEYGDLEAGRHDDHKEYDTI